MHDIIREITNDVKLYEYTEFTYTRVIILLLR